MNSNKHTQLELLKGEYTVGTPPVTSLNGRDCVPQHYLTYEHTLETVEYLVMDIKFDDHYPIFVGQDNSGIYMQVGIIGVDNYLPKGQQQTKIVYGRKWRVEPNLPTSEVIQTALLALKTAREHEIRELFKLTTDYAEETKVTTPFNNHHDLPLLVNLATDNLKQQNQEHDEAQIQAQLARARYAGCSFALRDMQKLSDGSTLIQVELLQSQTTSLPELQDKQFISFIVAIANANQVLHELMSQLLQLSNRLVEETFTFRGVARFSRNYDLQAIADISVATRQLHKTVASSEFENLWLETNYETDLTRVPNIRKSELGEKIKNQLEQLGPIQGAMPIYGGGN